MSAALTFEQRLIEAVQDSVLKMAREGGLVMPEYSQRAKVPPAQLQALYDAIDWQRVRSLCLAQVEEKCADTMLNAMATEIATDIKQVLSNKELREEVRTFIRAGINRVAKAAAS